MEQGLSGVILDSMWRAKNGSTVPNSRKEAEEQHRQGVL